MVPVSGRRKSEVRGSARLRLMVACPIVFGQRLLSNEQADLRD